MGGITTHSTGAESAWMSSARLNAWSNVSRPVNSGVIHAWRLRHATVRSSLTGGMPQPRGGLTGDSTRPEWSMPLIENLSVMQLSPGGSIPALDGQTLIMDKERYAISIFSLY